MSTLRMKLPLIGTLCGDSLQSLVDQMEALRDEHGYDASDIGAQWAVFDPSGRRVATVSYNGRVEAV